MSTTTMMRRPNLQDLVKEAMEGTAQRVDLSIEATRQHSGQVKTAAAAPQPRDVTPTEYVDKLAAALEYLAKQAEEEGPGHGPGALEVTHARGGENNMTPSGQGKAKEAPPMNPPSASSGEPHDPATGLETNAKTKHPEQPADPVNGKTASADDILARNLARMGLAKIASPSLLERNMARLGLSKVAEDRIDPAQISAGAAKSQGATPPEGAGPSGVDVPAEPADVNSQKRLISSNEAAINYTKREAKADPKSDAEKLLNEPVLSSSTDSTLQKALEHTNEAGTKISSAKSLTKTAAAQALLQKLAEEVESEKSKGEKKEKRSGMSGLQTPSGQSGFSASQMGGGQ